MSFSIGEGETIDGVDSRVTIGPKESPKDEVEVIVAVAEAV